MSIVLQCLAGLLFIVAIGCYFYVTIDAFKDEVWKGFLCLFTCLAYWVYYAVAEFDHEYKWPIFAGAAIGFTVGPWLVNLAVPMMR